MGSERARLENKYADLLERRKQHPIIAPPTPDASSLSSVGGLRHNGGRISNSRDRTPYRLNDYTKPAPAVAPGKYQYKTRPRTGGLQTSASTSAVYRPHSPTKASLYARPSPPPLDASKRRPYGGSATSRQSLQVDSLSRNKLVLSNYEDHLNGLVRPPLDKSPRNRYDDFEASSRHYFASRAQDEVPKYRQRSEAARYSSSLATSKSCHSFGHGGKPHQYTSVNKAIATLRVLWIFCAFN